ncbi:hypothetical protein CDO73_25940 [Saccharibacillus sp. O23]|nr:hypothetical protein CDO73_25940 [Saccharibacillus sp. O23]
MRFFEQAAKAAIFFVRSTETKDRRRFAAFSRFAVSEADSRAVETDRRGIRIRIPFYFTIDSKGA